MTGSTFQKVIIGNSLDVLKSMESESIDLCITSPPYWSLRDYKSEPVVWGGDPQCDHTFVEHVEPARGGVGSDANVGANKDAEANNRGHPTITAYCSKCGAWKGQLGLEPTPFEYIDHLCDIFDEVKRVLKPTGACWVNIGDTYNGSKIGNTETKKNTRVVSDSFKKQRLTSIGVKCLIQIPSRFAIEMCNRGWILRNEVIWHKPNAMPMPVKDRFTVDFEKMFFFTKNPDYYFKQITEPMVKPGVIARFGSKKTGNQNNVYFGRSYDASELNNERNARTVWTIPTKPSTEDHCAMFPTSLIERPIMACCPDGGIVLDPFCGSGTTLEYCRKHDINGIGIEINPDFEPIIKRRAMMDLAKMEDFL